MVSEPFRTNVPRPQHVAELDQKAGLQNRLVGHPYHAEAVANKVGKELDGAASVPALVQLLLRLAHEAELVVVARAAHGRLPHVEQPALGPERESQVVEVARQGARAGATRLLLVEQVVDYLRERSSI